jgi:hypothetical protein
MASWALDVAGPGMVWVDSIVGSRTSCGAQRHGLGVNDIVAGSGMASRAWGWRLCGQWHHWLRLGKMVTRKCLDHDQERWFGGSEEDLTMAGRLWGGLDDDTGSGEVDDGMDPGKFWARNFGILTA